MKKGQGVVKSLRKDGKSVCITVELETGPQDHWLDLGDKIKPNFIKVGSKCDFSYTESEEGNPVLLFIKCEGGFKPSSGYQKPAYNSGSSYKPQAPAVNDEMIRMSALKASGAVYSGSGKEAEFKKLTDEIINYIKGGNWNEAKFVQKGEISTPEDESYY